MNGTGPSFLSSLFRFIIAKRWWVVGIYALLLVPSAYYAFGVKQDNEIDRLIVDTDPDYVAAKRFEKVFGTGEYVVLLAEAPDPYARAVLQRVNDLEQRLKAIPMVETNSAIDIFRRKNAGFSASPEEAEAFHRFMNGTDLFRKQGLIGEHFLSIPLILTVHNTDERHAVLEKIDAVIAPIENNPAPLSALRKVGQPYVNLYLDTDTRTTGMRYFALFFLFVVVLNLSLYRSFRTLLAFIVPLSVSAAMTVGFVGITGGVFTIVSTLVPMTILIVCTATLVYIHSRFVDHPAESTVWDHQIFALQNKFLACTASVFATAVGFAALAVSKIRPIREMGIWVAVGLLFTWIIVFTLFPALQRILHTPTQRERKVAGQWFLKFVDFIPAFSYRYRYLLVPGALFMCVVGALALFGVRGLFKGMELETNAIEYIPHDSALYRDTKQIEKIVGGLSITNVWLRGKQFDMTRPAVLRGLAHFQQALEKEEKVGAVVGLPTILATLRYIAGKGDRLPEDDETLSDIGDQMAELLPKESMLQRFIDRTNLAQTNFSVITPTMDFQGFQKMQKVLQQHWMKTQARDPALAGFTMEMVGLAPLQAKISYHLVPTLTESFGLTVVIIFAAFLLIFRNGPARLMAMIPSLFAILVMFAVMRVTGMTLNVATILIASTVLGTSENDQIHFFYHFLEKRKNGTTEEALRHTLHIAGRAIFFATLINAGGFLAFALARLPPIRQFGMLSCLAFILSMIADFTALPAALWMVFRDRPDALKKGPAPVSEAGPPGS